MKKTLVLLAAFVLTVGAASAQSSELAPAARPAQRNHHRAPLSADRRADLQTQRLTKQLSLSADQTAQVRPIALAENQEMEALRGKLTSADARQGAMQELKALREKYDAQLKAVLTADQVTKYNQLRDEQLNKRKDKLTEGRSKGKAKA